MAASNVAMWMVVVFVDEDENLNKTFKLSPETSISELLEDWKDEFELVGHWILKSADKQVAYQGWMTLEMVGETVPHSQIVTLKAELIDEPAPMLFNEIYVCLNGGCHHLFVTPHEKLCDVMWRLPGRPSHLEYNGKPLNPKHTIKQAGLQNQSVIYEPLCSVTVRMSSGYSRVIKMPLGSLVCNLKEKVNDFEADDFSLKYQGRILKSDESVRFLTQTVEVASVEFAVNVDGRRVSWRTKEEPISVNEFVSQLLVKTEIDSQQLEELEFVCVGCHRHISNSDDSVQLLPVECCKEKSMTLDAMAPLETRRNSTSDVTQHVQNLCDNLQRCRKDSTAKVSRCQCREMKEKLGREEGLDYNVLVKCSQSLRGRVIDLEDEVTRLKVVVDTLKTKNVESEQEIERLHAENRKSREEIQKLRGENENLKEDNDKLRLPPTPTKPPGVKLLVLYRRDAFSPVVSRPELQSRGQHSSLRDFVRCEVGELRPGWATFGEVRDAVQRLFTERIKKMFQYRGSVAGRPVAWVTTLADDEEEVKGEVLCDADGRESRWGDVKKDSQWIREGGRVFIAGGRRTILEIYDR